MMTQRLDLPEVTLVAATAIALSATIRALSICVKQVRFGRALLLSPEEPDLDLPSEIEWRPIDRLNSREDYSKFMFCNLADHIDTRHALCVQWDGYIIDASRWSDDFLQYDYIGARWPQFSDGQCVGNGGFSLRSRDLLVACATSGLYVSGAEDVEICRTHRGVLENDFGLRFAGPEVADCFAYERSRRSGREFGFHGAFNMPDLMPAREIESVYASLEPSLLGDREMRDLIRRSLMRCHIGLAMRIWRDRQSRSIRQGTVSWSRLLGQFGG